MGKFSMFVLGEGLRIKCKLKSVSRDQMKTQVAIRGKLGINTAGKT